MARRLDWGEGLCLIVAAVDFSVAIVGITLDWPRLIVFFDLLLGSLALAVAIL